MICIILTGVMVLTIMTLPFIILDSLFMRSKPLKVCEHGCGMWEDCPYCGGSDD